MSRSNRQDRRKLGTSMITVLVALVALIAISSLAIDIGIVWAARNQMQNAADAAALSGAGHLIDKSGPTVTIPLAETAATEVAAANGAVSAASVNLPVSDITIGNWDMQTETFDSSVNLTDPSVVSAVKVDTALDGVANGPVPSFFARVLGRNSFNVSATATAYLGWAGSFGPGEVDFPIAIDCCKLKGPECKEDYCKTIAENPINPCPLDEPQDDGVTTVTCLQFHATEEQNACWTQFSGDDPSINGSDLTTIVHDGNAVEVRSGEPLFVDNGDKANVIKEIEDKFYRNGKYSNEPDRDVYPPYDGVSDSWVVGLPVVSCQTEDGCAGGVPTTLVGIACFEIREVEDAPLKTIRGRFLCETDPLFKKCDVGLTGSGGLDFGIRADLPVLVR